MRYFQLAISFDGARFSGWQLQPTASTIHSAFLSAFQTLKLDPQISVSGRTDAGVSAKVQFVGISVECSISAERLKGSLNGLLPEDIKVLKIEEMDQRFSARSDSKTKCYSYSLTLTKFNLPLYGARALPVGSDFNVASACAAAELFVGTNDFASFRSSDCGATTTVRTITCSQFSRIDDNILEYRVHGKGFLKQMVRIMVGTLVEVGKGKLFVDSIEEILAGRNRNLAGPTVPAEPLVLEWVRLF